MQGSGYAPQGALCEGGRPLPAADTALRRCCRRRVLCNDAQLLPPDGERGAWTVLGDPTEGALLVLAPRPAST